MSRTEEGTALPVNQNKQRSAAQWCPKVGKLKTKLVGSTNPCHAQRINKKRGISQKLAASRNTTGGWGVPPWGRKKRQTKKKKGSDQKRTKPARQPSIAKQIALWGGLMGGGGAGRELETEKRGQSERKQNKGKSTKKEKTGNNTDEIDLGWHGQGEIEVWRGHIFSNVKKKKKKKKKKKRKKKKRKG